MTNIAGDRAELVTRALDAVGIAHELRRTQSGEPYAGFRVVGDAGVPLSYTAMFRGEVLQLVLHDAFRLSGAAFESPLLNSLNETSAVAAFSVSDGGRVDVSLGLLALEGVPPADAVRNGVELLRGASYIGAAAVAEGGAFAIAWLERLQELHLGLLPERDGESALEELERVSAAAGIEFRRLHGGRMLAKRFADDDGHAYRLEAFAADDRLLVFRARAEVDGFAPALAHVEEMNRRLAIGVAALASEPALAYYRVGTPLAWTRVDDVLLQWSIERASAASRALVEEKDA